MAELKIGFPPGSLVKTKFFKFKKNKVPVKEIIEEIVKTSRLTNPEQYVLFIPPTAEVNCTWMDEAKLLSDYPLQPKDLIELRKKFQVLKIRFRRVKQRVLVDINEPLSHVMPLIAKKFQLDNIADFRLIVRKQVLDLTKSIRQLQISADLIFELRPKSQKEEDVEQEDYLEEEKQDTKEEVDEESEEPIDDANVPAKGIKNPQKEETLNMKSNRKKKFEPRFVILKGSKLYIYKSPNDKKPLSFLELGDFKLKLFEADEKEKKEKNFEKEWNFTFELVPEKEKEETHFFKCDDEVSLKSWMTTIRGTIDHLDPSNAAVFGVDIEKATPPGKDMPEIVQLCIKYISENALDVVGIFRLSGSALQIEEYKQSFDRGERPDLSKEGDPHCISGLLKLYLRSLPEPLFTYALYDNFIAAQSAPNQHLRMRYLKGLVGQLPKINAQVTKTLFEFLGKVNAHSATNKMMIPNLATVFGPNLLVSPDRSMFQMVQDTPQINGIVANLIQNYDAIFLGKEAPEVVAVALYDYQAVDSTEISFSAGEILKVLSQYDDGWWEGEIHGNFGKFPGSYVKIETKSKKEQFKQNMQNVENQLEEERKMIKSLETSKSTLEREIAELSQENTSFEAELRELRNSLILNLKKEQMEGLPLKITLFNKKLEALKENKTKEDAIRKNLSDDIHQLRQLLKNPPMDAKKALKGKVQEKVEAQIGGLMLKMNPETKKRVATDERFNDVFDDFRSLNQLLTLSSQ
eukprot:TRINITY_DN6971_c0_g2_i1.p1 TRINITY_DN6971_c0_g2~~TRINITY_DN6971_c0_g2_i1.p1  ORF type:complete len:753 (+),score=275.78 TRINITY_DN6971_c0_g2_i1:22-2259(+)